MLSLSLPLSTPFYPFLPLSTLLLPFSMSSIFFQGGADSGKTCWARLIIDSMSVAQVNPTSQAFCWEQAAGKDQGSGVRGQGSGVRGQGSGVNKIVKVIIKPAICPTHHPHHTQGKLMCCFRMNWMNLIPAPNLKQSWKGQSLL